MKKLDANRYTTTVSTLEKYFLEECPTRFIRKKNESKLNQEKTHAYNRSLEGGNFLYID
jgi:hypothetical protein